MIIQRGRRGEKAGDVPSGYVEDFFDPRTKLGIIFSVPLPLVSFKERYMKIIRSATFRASKSDEVGHDVHRINAYGSAVCLHACRQMIDSPPTAGRIPFSLLD
jgi:hypothetical protein